MIANANEDANGNHTVKTNDRTKHSSVIALRPVLFNYLFFMRNSSIERFTSYHLYRYITVVWNIESDSCDGVSNARTSLGKRQRVE